MIENMEHTGYKNLIELADCFAAHENITHWRVSFLARGDGGFIKRLRAGGGCTVKTADVVFKWFSNNWPADLEWPAHIQRPTPTDKKDAA